MNTLTNSRTKRRTTRLVAGVAALALVAAACGDDDDSSSDTTTAATEATTESTDEMTEDTTESTDEMTEDTSSDASDPGALDGNADGEVVFAIATPGPRDDGAFYQALVEGVTAFTTDSGYPDPIIVDNIDPAQAETELRNLARQNPDVIAVGAGEISDPLEALAEEFPDILWYCNCGAGQQIPGIAQSSDDSSQISYSAGYATGLLLQETDSTTAAFLGCCDLDFEQEAYNAFELGLQAVDPSFTSVYIPTGDFNDVAGATEAFNQAVADGAGAVYPFLGGAHEPIVALANENDVIVMSAGASDVCERDDLDYDIAVQFDAGDYLDTVIGLIANGELAEGETFLFEVGAFDFVGAKFCDATPEQEAALDDVKAQIANGDFEEEFFAIKSEAYGF
ncbi:MAG: BMP family ABC transporter substrate-binding protein [Actinomycetota bacterium]